MTTAEKQTYEELIDGILQHDSVAFERLVDQSHRVVRKIAVPLLPASSIDDAVQETYLLVFQKLHHLRDPGAFLGWLSRIALNVCYKMRNKNGFTEELTTDHRVESSQSNVMLDIRAALSRLSKKERNVMILREYIGLSYEEISLAVGAPVGTVRSRLFKARQRLQAVKG